MRFIHDRISVRGSIDVAVSVEKDARVLGARRGVKRVEVVEHPDFVEGQTLLVVLEVWKGLAGYARQVLVAQPLDREALDVAGAVEDLAVILDEGPEHIGEARFAR